MQHKVVKEEAGGPRHYFSGTLSTRLLQGWVMLQLPYHLYSLGRGNDGGALLIESGWTWSSIDRLVDKIAAEDSEIRPRGSSDRTRQAAMSAEAWSWFIRLSFVLCMTWRDVPRQDVIATLPSPEALVSYATSVGTQKASIGHRHGILSLPLMAAQVCEQLEQFDDSLKYAAAALTFVTDDNPSASADMRPTTFAQAHALRGRVFAGQGAHEDAERSFAAAIHCAKSHGLRLYEMLAVRDLKRLVLDGDGREEEGTKQLKAVLQEMHGPAEELTKLLGDGFDAEEILRS
jgi:hypothetical protein